jgi:hypothetical protein
MLAKTLEDALGRGVDGHSGSGDVALEVSGSIAGFGVLIDGEGSGECVSGAVDCYQLLNLRRADEVQSGVIVGCGEVVELVGADADLLPDAHAHVADERGTAGGLHDLGSVAVPLGVACVEFGSVGESGGVLKEELDVPHADDRDEVLKQIVGHEEVAGLGAVEVEVRAGGLWLSWGSAECAGSGDEQKGESGRCESGRERFEREFHGDLLRRLGQLVGSYAPAGEDAQ